MHIRSARAVLLILLGLVPAACAKKTPPAPGPATVTVSQPLQKDVVDWDDFQGRFEAVDQVDVRPRVSGYLTEIGFKDGEVVKKGQTLFVIDPRPYQATLDQTKAQTERAQATLTNARTALERGAGVGQGGLGALGLGLGLVERGLVGARVDDEQGLALLHHLAVLEADLGQIARHARAHVHLVDRLEAALEIVPVDHVLLQGL